MLHMLHMLEYAKHKIIKEFYNFNVVKILIEFYLDSCHKF